VADVFDIKTRSKNMSRIRAKDTKPELIIRRLVHKRGFRYRIHRKDLPGKPDIVLPKHNLVIFVNGCFWHGHKCHLFHWPKSKSDFWEEKIRINIQRDLKNIKILRNMGWRVMIIWECSIKGKYRQEIDLLTHRISSWIITNEEFCEFVGHDLS
jgi:DNA mismatch endonuclease (patch repair protein)|tara:strand:+ start:22083 stop:22544 length:462 start_codon:yes stop_codon:yes gene_type:complete